MGRLTMDPEEEPICNKSFKHPRINPLEQVRLLRIWKYGPVHRASIECTLHVVRVSDLPRIQYATFSYCWGEVSTDENVYEISVDKQRFWVRANLWSFLQSTQSSEIHMPLFIDAICLNQFDLAERGLQVRSISEVYLNAEQCHAWLGNPTAEEESNLEVLRMQLSEYIPPASWDIKSHIGLSYICSRDYWRSLWVVQEVLISKAVMIHCGCSSFSSGEIMLLANFQSQQRILSEPGEVAWRDAWAFPKSQSPAQSKAQEEKIVHGWQSALYILHHRSQWAFGFESLDELLQLPAMPPKGLPFHRTLASFRHQQCRDRKDKVFALFGLLDNEGKSMITPDYQSPIEEIFLQAATAGLVSSWKRNKRPQSVTSPTNRDRLFCQMLLDVLDLSDGRCEERVSKAVDTAVFYMYETQLWQPEVADENEQDLNSDLLSLADAGDAREQLISGMLNWYGLDHNSFGRLLLLDSISVSKGSDSWQLLDVYFFKTIFIMVKDKRSTADSNGNLGHRLERSLRLKGSILLNHLSNVEYGSEPNVLELNLSVTELPRMDLKFSHSDQLEIWRKTLFTITGQDTLEEDTRGSEHDSSVSDHIDEAQSTEHDDGVTNRDDEVQDAGLSADPTNGDDELQGVEHDASATIRDDAT